MPVLTICKCGNIVQAKPCDDCKKHDTRTRNAQPTRRAHRSQLHRRIRLATFERDNWACVQCGSTQDLTLDYIEPLAQGGTMTLDNARTLCRPHNSQLGGAVRRA